MKPNKKQLLVGKIIEQQARFWQSTNDITSPTHTCDIGEFISNEVVFGNLLDEEAAELEEKLIDLYFFVRNLKD